MEIGISWVSLFPLSILDPMGITRWAEEAGFDFIQGIPLRGINQRVIENSPLPILFCEDAWNPGTLWQVIMGKMRKDPTAPKPHDWLLFPGPKQCEIIYLEMIQAGAIPVVHYLGHMGETSLLEVSPKLGLSPQAVAKAVRARRLVLDTYHLQRPPWPDEISYNVEGVSPLGDWHESLTVLSPYAALIHVSPHRDKPELQEFLAGQPTELEEMLATIITGGFNGPMVVEATLGLKGFNQKLLKQTMSDFLLRLKEIIKKHQK